MSDVSEKGVCPDIFIDLTLDDLRKSIEVLEAPAFCKTTVHYHKEINKYIMYNALRIMKKLPADCRVYEIEIADFVNKLTETAVNKHFKDVSWDLQFFTSRRHLNLFYYNLLSQGMYSEITGFLQDLETVKFDLEKYHKFKKCQEYTEMVLAIYKAWYKIFNNVFDEHKNKNI